MRFPGITANPALGYACDLLVAQGGTGVLAETPEIYGAEHLLTRRAIDTKTGEKLVGLIRWWEDYTERNKGSMDNNPSPGNKKGGLTTILEKSLGAAAKGGTTPLTGVYKYAEPITKKALPLWTRPAMTRHLLQARLPAAAIWWSLPPGAALPLAQNPLHASKLRPIQKCMNG